MKHTKGPWEINGTNEDNGRTRIGSAKDYICELYHNPDDDANEEENDLQTKANANLIAAAPELLDTLIATQENLAAMLASEDLRIGDEEGIRLVVAVEAMSKTIAKAEGK